MQQQSEKGVEGSLEAQSSYQENPLPDFWGERAGIWLPASSSRGKSIARIGRSSRRLEGYRQETTTLIAPRERSNTPPIALPTPQLANKIAPGTW